MFLAATGLLDGKKCTTHWHFANEFRRLYPKVNLLEDKVITDDDGIYTSGGAYAFTNLIIYLIEKYAGKEIAIDTAKAFMIDIDRESQSPFIVFSGQKSHGDTEVLNVQSYIESHFSEKITVESLCDRVSLGRRTFERRFKKAMAYSIVEYLQHVRVEAAKRKLEIGRKTINEVMLAVGYNDTTTFRDVFKKVAGLSPVEYRNKYNKVIE